MVLKLHEDTSTITNTITNANAMGTLARETVLQPREACSLAYCPASLARRQRSRVAGQETFERLAYGYCLDAPE